MLSSRRPEVLREGLRSLHASESAPLLLGWRILTWEGLEAEIVEVEGYGGSDDPGSHAFRGPTPRCRDMFGQPGHAYIYLSYGVHWMLNVACRPEGEGSAILFRAARPVKGIETMRTRRPKAGGDKDLLSGPGRLTAALAIGPSHSGLDLLSGESPLRLLPPDHEGVITPLAGVRIGIAEGKGDEATWRHVWGEKRLWASRPQTPQSLSPAQRRRLQDTR